VGLLFIQRMPPRLLWQAGTLLLTGILLSPLLPENRGRVALTTPFALSVAQAQRLRDRDPAAALLGLAAWIGSDPLMFLFLNGSPLCLLAWGLLPIEDRVRFDWVQWLVAALPLGILVSAGSLTLLYLLLRPRVPMTASRERVRVQLAVLGPPTFREYAMIGVLVLTVAGWFFAPALHMEVGTIAVLGLLAAIVTGNFDQRSLRELDWSYLIFYGVALSTAALRGSFGVGGESSLGAIGRFSTGLLGEANGLVFVMVIAGLHVLVRLVIHQNQAILLLGIALIPVAPTVGVDPWIVVITLLATSSFWFLRTQTPSYLVAYTSSEGRLFSHDQARLAGIGYTVVVLLSLALSVPYWHWLGLL
jgi:di/tricarboxylate transporter